MYFNIKGNDQIIGTEKQFIHVLNSSISSGCVSFVISSVSALHFKSIDQQSLSGHFLSTKEATNFAVLNQNKAVIGK